MYVLSFPIFLIHSHMYHNNRISHIAKANKEKTMSGYIPTTSSKSHGVCITPSNKWDTSKSSSSEVDSEQKPCMVRTERCLSKMKTCLRVRRANLAILEDQHNYMWGLASQTQNNVDLFENYLKDIEDKLKELSEEIERDNVPANSLLVSLYKEKMEHKETLEDSILEREAQIEDVEHNYKEIEVKIEEEKKKIEEMEKDIKEFKKHHEFTEDFDYVWGMAQEEW